MYLCDAPTVTAMAGDRLRRTVAGAVNRLVVGSADRPERLLDPSDPGPIAYDSPVRSVHADASMFIGGVRALLLQTLHPVAMFAIDEHSAYRHDAIGRLQRTAMFIGQTTFGSGAEADQAIAMINAIHSRVTGVLPDGSIYRADDPHLLGWVHATEVDSFLTSYQRFGPGRLSDAEADQYVADMAPIAEALGVDDAPLNRAELAATLDSYRDELMATPQCRDATRFLFAPELPITILPFYGVIFSAAVATLPRYARSMLLLPVAPLVDPLVLRPAAGLLTRTVRWAAFTHEPLDPATGLRPIDAE